MTNTIFTVTTPSDTIARMVVEAPNRRAVIKALNNGLDTTTISRGGKWYDINESHNQNEQPQHVVDQCGHKIH